MKGHPFATLALDWRRYISQLLGNNSTRTLQKIALAILADASLQPCVLFLTRSLQRDFR
jgi:hypothetical protein